MRIAFIGVSHWHSEFYIEPALEVPGGTVVGVADPQEEARDRWAGELGVDGFADYQVMCEKTKPDLVFALGRHIDMAATARYLMEAGIPFAMEKPCGISVDEIARVEELARTTNAFAAVAFAYRYSTFRKLIDRFSPGAELTYGLFRLIPGSAARYYDGWDAAWNLDPRIAGGGCTVNLSIHFFDLVRVLAPSEPWHVVGATMSNELSEALVEDFSATLLKSGGRRASVETGYIFPTKNADNEISVCVGGDYYKWVGRDRKVTVTLANGEEHVFPGGRSQASYYGDFVSDVITRVREQRSPDADMTDMLMAARTARSAYQHAGYDEFLAERDVLPAPAI